VKIVKKTKEVFGKAPFLVVGGAHLEFTSKKSIKKIIADLKEAGVRQAALSHCTGDRAGRLFEEAYGKEFLPSGAGFQITVEDL
jgi:7,8-dihydropterin-6-yl-methyl-4-(beta-D-ribofuranosyl)aminobenzene 5'-phosphate synthase